MDMPEAGEPNMDKLTDQFCTYWFTMRVANIGTLALVKSWNTQSQVSFAFFLLEYFQENPRWFNVLK